MPWFAASTVSNIYVMVKNGYNNRQTLFEQLFLFRSGDFFIILVLQNGSYSTFMALTSITGLWSSYFSPKLLVKLQEKAAALPNWARKNLDIFEFGASYSQNVVIMGVAIMFQ